VEVRERITSEKVLTEQGVKESGVLIWLEADKGDGFFCEHRNEP
jgi:hypothetical protein